MFGTNVSKCVLVLFVCTKDLYRPIQLPVAKLQIVLDLTVQGNKSCIRETLNLLMCADSSTHTETERDRKRQKKT